MRIAGVLQTKNYVNTYDTVRTLRRVCDFVVVLDDNSTESSIHQHIADIDVLLSIKHNQLFNCQSNRTMLFYQAWANRCEWVMTMDDDIFLSNSLCQRESIFELVSRAVSQKADMVRVEMRDLWNDTNHYRCDGIWANKTFPLLQRVWCGDPNITLKHPESNRLHYPCCPSGNEPVVMGAHRPLVVYHTGCMTRADRQMRVDKYKMWDARNEYQADYSYMLDETGMTIAEVPIEDRRI